MPMFPEFPHLSPKEREETWAAIAAGTTVFDILKMLDGRQPVTIHYPRDPSTVIHFDELDPGD